MWVVVVVYLEIETNRMCVRFEKRTGSECSNWRKTGSVPIGYDISRRVLYASSQQGLESRGLYRRTTHSLVR